MVSFRNRGEDDLGQTAYRAPSRRGSASSRRRRTSPPLERLEERTLLSFTPIPQPTGAYTGATTNMVGSIPADGTTLTTLSDGTESVTFSQTMTAATVPAGGANNWGSPPNTEANAGTRPLFELASPTALNLTLSKPANEFGFELEGSAFNTSTLTVTFFEGGTAFPAISRAVTLPGAPIGSAADGALLFAASTNQAFTSVVISGPAATGGFNLANVRYALASATLGITKSAALSEVQPGHNQTYTIGLTNSGPNDAIGATVTDPLPAGTNFQAETDPGSPWVVTTPPIGSGGTVTFTDTDPFATGDSATFTIVVQVNSGVPAGTTITDTATGASLDSNSPTASASFTVGGPLTGSAGNEITGVEGSSTGTVLLGTFVDANQNSTAVDYTTAPGSVVVNWGDGSAPQILTAANLTPIGTPNGVVWTINAAHAYTEEGTYAYTVTVTSVDGAAAVVAGSAIIADADLTAVPQPAALVPNTGVPLPDTTVVASFTDANLGAPNTDGDFTATIDWGDGSPKATGKVVLIAPGVFDVQGGHTYAKAGVFTTKVSVADDGGETVTVPGTSAVADLPVTGTGNNFTAIEGLSAEFLLATFEDPNTLATVSNVNATLGIGGWGDGTPSVPGVQLITKLVGVDPNNLEPIFQVFGTHTYAEETPTGSPLVTTVIVTTLGASDFTTTTLHGNVTVLDAGLTGSEGGEITDFEGDPTPPNFLLGTFVDANQGAPTTPPLDYTTQPGSVVVNWGDGSAPQTLTAANLTPIGTPEGVSWNVNAPHMYAEEGTYAYTVTVTDDGGASTTITGSAVIADADLTAGTVTLTPAAPNAGIPVSIAATFTDANTVGPNTDGDFSAVIDWGDGSPTSLGTVTGAAGAFSVAGTHTYAKPNAPGTHYNIKVNVSDDGGETITIPGTAIVTDLPVTDTTNNFTTQEGQDTGLFVLATFVDPNTLATVADVNATLANNGWGDGTPVVAPGGVGPLLVVQEIGVTPLTSPTNPGDPIFEVLGRHVYTEETPPGLPDTLSVIITTLGGQTTTLTSPPGGGVTVLDAPLESSNGTEITGIEGNPIPVAPDEPATLIPGALLGTFSDANPLPPQGSAAIADFTSGTGSTVVYWGDGTMDTLTADNYAVTGTNNGATFSIYAPHTYMQSGTFAFKVVVTDDGGSTTTISGSAIIGDAPLTPVPLDLQPTVSSDEATTFPIPQFGGKPPTNNPDQVFDGPVAYFTDGNPLSTIADFTAKIDWGDGTPPTAGTIGTATVGGATVYSVTGTHTYADSGVNGGVGNFNIQVFVTDDDGDKLTLSTATNTLPAAQVTDKPITVTGTLNPKSDSGLSTGTPDVTNVKQPDFFGTVLATLPSGAQVPEGYADVSLFATDLATGITFPIGQKEAGSDGSWNIKSTVALLDGSYEITATAIDQFGQTTTTGPDTITADLLIDTVGPVITAASFDRLHGQVDYTIQDPFPGSGVWVNTLVDSSNYLLTKVHANKAFPGKWIVTNVDVTPGEAAGSYDVVVTFNSGKPIKGGFYLFTIRDSSNGDSSVQDLAENHLDGVFYGSFPSGNGINGSDFVAELDAFHNKIFAPQTIIGTANPGNGGVGGPPVGAVHSGHFTTTGTVPKKHHKSHPKAVVAKPSHAVHDAALHKLVTQAKTKSHG